MKTTKSKGSHTKFSKKVGVSHLEMVNNGVLMPYLANGCQVKGINRQKKELDITFRDGTGFFKIPNPFYLKPR